MACEESPAQLNLLLIGKTGVGKSRTGNSILGKKAFKVSGRPESKTARTDFDEGKYGGRLIKVVDLPGVCDTDVNEKKGFELAIKEAMLICPEGYDGFLYVRQYCNRFTAEDIKVFEFLKEIFGRDFVKQMFILVLTYGDNFELEHEEDGLTFEHWCQNQNGHFQDLLKECRHRIVLFNNRTDNDTEKIKQVDKLLSFVMEINIIYTDDTFERQKFFTDFKRYEEETILLKLKLLFDKFQELQVIFSKDEFLELSSECSQLLLLIKTQVEKTPFLYKLQKELESLKISVDKVNQIYLHNGKKFHVNMYAAAKAMEEITLGLDQLRVIYKEKKKPRRNTLLAGFALVCVGVAVAPALGGAVALAGAGAVAVVAGVELLKRQ